ncbi:MAG: sensor histidine kinase [Prevotella sp.]|nr:sensor histidine kinase [Prevotella sp.]
MQHYHTDKERIASLIDSYREEIGGVNSKNAKAIQDYIEAEEKKVYEAVEKRIANGEKPPIFDSSVNYPMEMAYKVEVNEQLIGHFYSKVAGSIVDNNVLKQLLADYYDDSFFSEEEEAFLSSHFKEVINYIINTSGVKFQEYSGLKEVHLLSSEILELITKQIEIPDNVTIYNPFTGLAQFASLFSRNHFICEESYTLGRERNCKDDSNWLWAWMKVALFANNVDSEIVDGNNIPSSYDYVFSYIPFTSIDFFINQNDDTFKSLYSWNCDAAIISKLEGAYQNLNKDGKMILLLPDFLLRKDGENYPLENFWKQVICHRSLVKIIHLPSTCNNLNYNFCLLVIDKGCLFNNVTMIDARFAKKQSDLRIIELEDYLDVLRENSKQKTESSFSPRCYKGVFIEGKDKVVEEYNIPFSQNLDLDLFEEMLHNNGIDPNTGLRKIVTINHTDLNPSLLFPQVYVIEKPQNVDSLIPLSKLCTFVPTKIRELKFDLPEDTPWVKERNLTYTFHGPLNILEVEKANCPNNPQQTEDFLFNQMGEFSEERPWSQRKPIGRRVIEYRKCTYLDGSKDAVLIKVDTKDYPFAVLAVEEKPIAIDKNILVFCPNDGVNIRTLAAIIKMPIVCNQIIAYENLGLENHLDDIIVPYDKWLIDNEVSRLLHEEEMANSLKANYENIKKSVRMRKHALTQSMSSIGAMFNALNAYRNRKGGIITDEEVISRVKGTTVNEAFDYLSKSIKNMMPVLEHIADVEYTFEKPEWIDPEAFIENYLSKNENGWINFKPVITWEKGHNIATNNIVDPSTGSVIFRRGEILSQFQFPKDALEKIFDNIISNAQSHGFVKSRADYKIKFSWYTEDKTVKILIENNGSPIPDDRDPSSLLEYGVSTVLHCDGHNGIGCNEIDDVMRRYDGKVDIISSPQEEYTVKYLLTFSRSNSIY